MKPQGIKKYLIGAAVSGLLIAAGAGPADAENNGHNGKITICHATGSATNPFVSVTVSDNGVAHRKHPGDIIPAPASGCPEASTTPTPTPTPATQPTPGGGIATPTPGDGNTAPTSAGGDTNSGEIPGGAEPAAIPEPVTLLLFGAGLAGIRYVKRRRNRS